MHKHLTCLLSLNIADKILKYDDSNPNNLGIDYGTAYPISQKFVFGVNLGL